MTCQDAQHILWKCDGDQPLLAMRGNGSHLGGKFQAWLDLSPLPYYYHMPQADDIMPQADDIIPPGNIAALWYSNIVLKKHAIMF